MATQKVVVAGSSRVTASQLKDLFRQIGDAGLLCHHLEAFLAHRNPFEHSATLRHSYDVETTPDVTAPVLENLFRQIKEGSITRAHVQALLEHRNPFEVSALAHVIDLDAAPYRPEGDEVVEHRAAGKLKWDGDEFGLYRSLWQRDRNTIPAAELREELRGQPVLNANVLDYLLKHRHLIPEELKGLYVFFWGTIYRDRITGQLYVRYLFQHDGGYWDWRPFHFNDGSRYNYFDSATPAAVGGS